MLVKVLMKDSQFSLNSTVIVYVRGEYIFFRTKNKMHCVIGQNIGPCKLHKLAKAVFPFFELCHPQFGTVCFSK